MINFGLNSASILAQVNFGTNAASFLGIVLAVSGAALYFLRTVRPELARDHDIFFAAIGLLSGFILIFQGWRYDPIMQFGQLLLTGATIFFAVESIRLRGVATEQAKRNTRIVDEDRPVSSVYSTVAELDDIEPLDEERTPPRRRIRGTKDARSTRMIDEYDDQPSSYYRQDEDEQPSRRVSSRSSRPERITQGDRPTRKRRPRTESRPSQRLAEDEWGSAQQQTDEDWDVSGSSSSKVSRSPRSSREGYSRSESRNSDVVSRPRKRRPTQGSTDRREPSESATSTEYTDYVDYKPIDRADYDQDNSANFDEP